MCWVTAGKKRVKKRKRNGDMDSKREEQGRHRGEQGRHRERKRMSVEQSKGSRQRKRISE